MELSFKGAKVKIEELEGGAFSLHFKNDNSDYTLKFEDEDALVEQLEFINHIYCYLPTDFIDIEEVSIINEGGSFGGQIFLIGNSIMVTCYTYEISDYVGWAYEIEFDGETLEVMEDYSFNTAMKLILNRKKDE